MSKIPKDETLGEYIRQAKETASVVTAAKNIGKAATVGVAVSGASGAQIMGTLAAVGGGVVAGTGVVAGSAGLGTATILNKTVFKDSKEAQVGSKAGAVAGTAASVGTLMTVGAGPAGLASIGAAVGGGMAAGAMLMLAAPAVGAAVIGGGIYWATKKKNSGR